MSYCTCAFPLYLSLVHKFGLLQHTHVHVHTCIHVLYEVGAPHLPPSPSLPFPSLLSLCLSLSLSLSLSLLLPFSTSYSLFHLLKDGRVFTFGSNSYGQLGHDNTQNLSTPTEVNALKGKEVCQIACGRYKVYN